MEQVLGKCRIVINIFHPSKLAMLQRGIIRNVVIVIRYSIKKSAHNIRLTMISNDIALWLYHYMMYDLYQWYSYMSGFFKYI